MADPLTHAELDKLLELHGQRLRDGEAYERFSGSVAELMPRIVAAVRATLPGELLLELHIPGFVPSGTLNSREHWSARKRRVAAEHQIVCAALASWHSKNGRALKPFPWVVTLTRCNVRRLDDDNCVGAMKGCRDSIAKWYGFDDRDDRITWRVEQKMVKRAGVGTIVEIRRRA